MEKTVPAHARASNDADRHVAPVGPCLSGGKDLKRIFLLLDADGGGAVSLDELHQAHTLSDTGQTEVLREMLSQRNKSRA